MSDSPADSVRPPADPAGPPTAGSPIADQPPAASTAAEPPGPAGSGAGDDFPSPASAVPWDLGHLRTGLMTTGVLAVVGVPAAWLLRDARAAAWVAVGLVIVAAFFSLGALAVAAAGKLGDELTLPAALGSYLVKIVLLGVLMVSVRDQPWLDPQALGLSVLVGTLAWTAVHAWRVWTTRIYYVDPGPRR